MWLNGKSNCPHRELLKVGFVSELRLTGSDSGTLCDPCRMVMSRTPGEAVNSGREGENPCERLLYVFTQEFSFS